MNCTLIGDVLKILAEHTEDVAFVAFSPDGNTLASGSHDTTIRLWDVQDRRSFEYVDRSYRKCLYCGIFTGWQHNSERELGQYGLLVGQSNRRTVTNPSTDIRGMLLLWHSHRMAGHSPAATMIRFTCGTYRPEHSCTRLRDTRIWWTVLCIHLTVSNL